MKFTNLAELTEDQLNSMFMFSEESAYGVYVTEGGDRYLFNRLYQPMMCYSQNINTTRIVSRDTWVDDIKFTEHFYTDSDSCAKRENVSNAVIQLWIKNFPLTPEEYNSYD